MLQCFLDPQNGPVIFFCKAPCRLWGLEGSTMSSAQGSQAEFLPSGTHLRDLFIEDSSQLLLPALATLDATSVLLVLLSLFVMTIILNLFITIYYCCHCGYSYFYALLLASYHPKFHFIFHLVLHHTCFPGDG